MVMCVDVVSDQPTDRTSSTQSWYSGRQAAGEMAAEFCLRNISIYFTALLPLRIFITLKNSSPSVGIEPANLGSSGEHANH
jgi:hypothetical protein